MVSTGDHREVIIGIITAILLLCVGVVCYAIFGKKKDTDEEDSPAPDEDANPGNTR
ncbi:MAG: hypothetical protein LBB67_05370 [Oscillospiraceae bacterium]|jgi:flagellar basal body-associated protein FliL|nr:hypothetical protein [Oscillospiraceae bacterium]